MLGENPQNMVSPEASTTGRIYFSQDLGQVIKVAADSKFSFMLPVGAGGIEKALTVTTIHTEMRLLGR